MAVLSLADIAKRTDPNGMSAKIAELLHQSNPILDDIPWMESNLSTGHRSTIRTGLPAISLRRINEGQGWDILDRKSVLAKVLRKFPDLQDIILRAASAASAPRKEVVFTSNRSYSEKQKQLEKIMTVDIPENSKEIEVARSYGDLRENAEFKYAKERQGLLMAQGAQLAEDLEQVKPSDFSDVATDLVAMGTGVELAYANGTTEVYYILGAWDQDEELAIISSETRLAQALLGHEAGDTVEIPSGECELKAILPVSDPVREWMKA